jgi:hypothetical protein
MLIGRNAATWMVLACLTSACAANSTRRGRIAYSATLVTTSELSRVGPGQTLLEALRGIRPSWLVSRGSQPQVSVDGAPATDLAILGTLLVTHAHEVRLHRSTSGVGGIAVATGGAVGDVIYVRTRGVRGKS